MSLRRTSAAPLECVIPASAQWAAPLRPQHCSLQHHVICTTAGTQQLPTLVTRNSHAGIFVPPLVTSSVVGFNRQTDTLSCN